MKEVTKKAKRLLLYDYSKKYTSKMKYMDKEDSIELAGKCPVCGNFHKHVQAKHDPEHNYYVRYPESGIFVYGIYG